MNQRKVRRSWCKTGVRMIALITILFSGLAWPALPTLAANAAPVQVYYLPLPEEDALTALNEISSGAGRAPMYTYFSIAIALDGTYIYYDQWEDGYAADMANPTGAEIYGAANLDGVQIWGNREADDGCAPNIEGVPFTCTDANDVLAAGDVILPDNTVALPRTGATPLFDAQDKIGASYAIAMARAVWATGSGTLNAFAHDMYPVNEWGTVYESPVGSDTGAAGDPSRYQFEYSAFTIMAAQDGTIVQIDANADGTYESSFSLDEGDTTLATGILQGARIEANQPVQVVLLTGDIGDNYESRDMALLPVTTWGSSYWSPVGVTYGSNPTRLYLYNLSTNGSIYITCEIYNAATTTQGPVAARGVVTQDLVNNQGAHCYASDSGGNPTGDLIFGVGTVDTATGHGNGNAFDWSLTLFPDTFLTSEVLVGLGLGKDPTNTTSTENGGPLWVTAACATGSTYVYVDWDNDGTPDGIDTNGDDVAETGSQNGILVDRLQSVRLFEPGADVEPYDQSGARVWSRTASGVGYGGTAGCKLAVVWGQDPANATAAAPGLDVGTSVPPLRMIESLKTLVLLIDNDDDGLMSPGDEAIYGMSVKNSGGAIVQNVSIYDTVPDNMTYVEDTTEYNMTGAAPWTLIPDDDSGTPYPLDVPGGILLGGLESGESYYVRFQVLLEDDYDYEEVHNCDVAYTGGGNAYRCATNLVASRDWGDLPDTYSTTSAQNGPRHSPSTLMLGAWFDRELEGQPTAGAAGDDLAQTTLPPGDDEDGVINAATTASWAAGDGAFAVTVAGGSGCLNAWMDFTNDAGSYDPSPPYTPYADGNFTNSGGYDSVTYAPTTYSEHIIQNTPLTEGTTTVSVSVPPSLNPGETGGFYFRFRLSPPDGEGACTATIAHNGFVAGGEVEDYFLPISTAIGDTIWYDWDGDGVQDAGEAGIPGVTVELWNADHTIRIATTTTDANGQYLFWNLDLGTYRVIVDTGTLPGGLTQTGDPDAELDNEHTVDANAPIYYDYVDFGYQGAGSISDFVWNDVDGDGVQDPEEAGISGVTVWIDLNNNGVQDPGEPFDVTDANGLYYIGNLPAGTFTVRVDADAGSPVNGATPTYDLDGVATANVASVPLAAGEHRTDVDWGYQLTELAVDKTSDAGGSFSPGDPIEYTIVVRNNTTRRHTGIAITDPLPSGTTYVAQSTVATGFFIPAAIVDTFPTVGNGTTGTGWTGGWVEIGENDGFAASDIQVIAAGLRIQDNDNGGEGAYREVNLSGRTSAWLSLDYTVFGLDSANEDVYLEISTNGGANWTRLYTWDGILANGSGSLLIDISAYIDSDTRIRFLGSASLGSTSGMTVDNVMIGSQIAQDTFPTVGNGTTGTGWTGGWVEIGENDGFAANDIQVIAAGLRIQDNDNGGEGAYREVNLSGYAAAWLDLTYAVFSLDNDNEDVYLEISTNGGANWTRLYTWDGILADGSGSLAVDISSYIDNDTRIRFLGSASLGGTSGMTVDNVRIIGTPIIAITRDNAPDGANPDLVNGTPPSLVVAGDGFALDPGQSMTVTIQVVVDDPLPSGTREIVNTVYVTSNQQRSPLTDTTIEELPTAVTLSNFWSTLGSGSILLHWETANELDNLGFHIERAESPTGQRTRLNASLIPSQAPGSATGFTYEFIDTTAQPGFLYYYWLTIVDTNMSAYAYGPISQRLGTGNYTVFLPLVDR